MTLSRRGAIVGFGGVAEHGHLPGWLRADGFEIVAVVDPSPARRAAAEARLPKARTSAVLDGLFDATEIDFVDIASPPAHHARAIEVAAALGAKYVKFWPGQDGHDYPFQADHAQIWDYAVNGVREIAEFAPQTQFAIEYKAKEPRVHITFSTAARTLLAIQEMGVSNVGIVLDFGHSLFAKETPADVLQLVHKHGKLVSVEVNDNWREWDDDLAVGTVHLIETLEFLHALRRIKWEAPILLDQFPFREDPVTAARASIRTVRALDRLLDRVDLNQLRAAQDAQDALAAQRLIQDLLLHN